MSKTIYEKFRAGAAISDSELNTCGENAIDVIRFLEKELRVVSGQYNQVVQQNKELQSELNTYKRGLTHERK